MDEVERAREATVQFENELRGQLHAEHKAERAEKRDERKAEFEEGKEIANAQFTSSTKEMLGTE